MAKFKINDALAEKMASDYLNEKMSPQQIGERYKHHPATVRRALIRIGTDIRSQSEGINYAKERIGKAHRGKKRNFTEEHLENSRKASRLRRLNYESVSIKGDGYLEINNGKNKGKKSHVVVMESFLGRPLRDGEIVHHIDHDTTNNDIDNLALMTASAHARLHRFEELLVHYRKRNKDGTFKKGEQNA